MTANIIPVADKFGSRLQIFIAALQTYIDEKRSDSKQKVSYEMGTKYIKVVTGAYGSQSVHCFIDFSGNIYKAASWRTPAKHIRGSIYDQNCGIGTAVTEYGAAYLR